MERTIRFALYGLLLFEINECTKNKKSEKSLSNTHCHILEFMV